MASGDRAARLFGTLMTLTGLGPITAPVIGGALTESTGRRGIFWLLAACVVGVLATSGWIPESLPAERRHTGGARATARALRGVIADRAYLGHALTFSLSFGMLLSHIAGSAFLFQKVLGLSVRGGSLAFAAVGIVATLASLIGTRLVTANASALALARASHVAGSAVLGTVHSTAECRRRPAGRARRRVHRHPHVPQHGAVLRVGLPLLRADPWCGRRHPRHHGRR
ncbi:MFS transporter [Streptomyces noursei]|uniref:MFS transporter n=1 Tax=Streptomyces noursei TaxID=1971 RepID=UPI0021557B3E|nr:MFS transporter [Streptomyces noursei]